MYKRVSISVCVSQVYMYMQVCLGVSACSEFICMCECL